MSSPFGNKKEDKAREAAKLFEKAREAAELFEKAAAATSYKLDKKCMAVLSTHHSVYQFHDLLIRSEANEVMQHKSGSATSCFLSIFSVLTLICSPLLPFSGTKDAGEAYVAAAEQLIVAEGGCKRCRSPIY